MSYVRFRAVNLSAMGCQIEGIGQGPPRSGVNLPLRLCVTVILPTRSWCP